MVRVATVPFTFAVKSDAEGRELVSSAELNSITISVPSMLALERVGCASAGGAARSVSAARAVSARAERAVHAPAPRRNAPRASPARIGSGPPHAFGGSAA